MIFFSKLFNWILLRKEGSSYSSPCCYCWHPLVFILLTLTTASSNLEGGEVFDFYVSVNGDDSNTGNYTSPFATLQRALEVQVATTGPIQIGLLSPSYPTQIIQFFNHSNPFVFSPVNSTSKPTFSSINITSTKKAMTLNFTDSIIQEMYILSSFPLNCRFLGCEVKAVEAALGSYSLEFINSNITGPLNGDIDALSFTNSTLTNIRCNLTTDSIIFSHSVIYNSLIQLLQLTSVILVNSTFIQHQQEVTPPQPFILTRLPLNVTIIHSQFINLSRPIMDFLGQNSLLRMTFVSFSCNLNFPGNETLFTVGSYYPYVKLALNVTSNCPWSCRLGSNDSSGIGLCFPCPPGSCANTSNARTCSSCLPGSYSSNSGAVNCDLCDYGYFQPRGGQATCNPCPPGTTGKIRGAEECETCPSEDVSKGLTNPCIPCNLGEIPRTDHCFACKDGQYIANKTCKNCDFFLTSNNYATCTMISFDGIMVITFGSSFVLIIMGLILGAFLKSRRDYTVIN